jgi:hypothetical protein
MTHACRVADGSVAQLRQAGHLETTPRGRPRASRPAALLTAGSAPHRPRAVAMNASAFSVSGFVARLTTR